MANEVVKPDFSYQWSSGGSIVAPSNVKIQTGWTAEVPPFQWENWSQNRQDNAILHLFQKGISEWDAASNYYFTTSGVRSYVQGSDGNVYVALQDSLNQDPTTATTYWKLAFPITGRLLRTSVYTLIAGVQNVSVNGGAFTTTGASAFSTLSNTSKLIAEACGGGGGSGATTATGASNFSVTGGGCGGSYGMGEYAAPVVAASVAIGAGGVAGVAPGGNGGTGGATNLGVLLSVNGGTGSPGSTAQTGNTVFGGAQPTKTVSGANVTSSIGGYGFYGISLTAFIGGQGGGSYFGPGGGPALAGGGAAIGVTGQSAGGGAGGSAAGPSQAAVSGAAGAAGVLIIREYA
jgi:hypothetical protein